MLLQNKYSVVVQPSEAFQRDQCGDGGYRPRNNETGQSQLPE